MKLQSDRDMILMDTGPLVALFDKGDERHSVCKKTLSHISGKLVTTWPVLTEAFYFLMESRKAQELLMAFVLSEAVQIHGESLLLPRMSQLMEKYEDLAMDFADASLVALAEEMKIEKVFTLDLKDFRIYRPKHAKHFKLYPEGTCS